MTRGKEAGLAAGYVWDNAWVEARRRLALLEELYDPATRRHLSGLGVGRGWSCLEVAGGGGSIAEFLCQQVGPDGTVVAVDLDVRFLQEIKAANLEVIQRDVVTDGLPGGGFDLVHVRALLMHLHQRDALLAALAAAVRPGGWLLVEEGDMYSIDALATGAYAGAWNAIVRATAPAGFDCHFARRLPELLGAHGLTDVGNEAGGSFFPGGSTGARFIQITLSQTLEKMSLPEADRRVLEEAITELDDPTRWYPSFVMVAAWGRRL